MKLGKLAPRHDKRTLKLARYLTSDLPPAPLAYDWGSKLSNLGVMLNDQLGDCTCAAMGHMVECWTANTGTQVTVPDSDVLAAYEGACGYDPKDPNTDRGGVMLDVLNYWRQTGIGGHKITAYVAVDLANRENVKQAIYLFGGLYLGVALPTSMQQESRWHVALGGAGADPGSWGGHCVCLVAYGPQGLTCVTWGGKLQLTWDFLAGYGDEGYAVLAPDWVPKISPSGFDINQLRADLVELAI